MDMSEEELGKRLIDIGNKLLSPSSLEELRCCLDLVESLFSRVDQSPSPSIKEALSPSINALITEQLLRHSDADVRVYVASCISELTRITAPHMPYSEDQMKEVFQLIVSSLEKLDVVSSPELDDKRNLILETIAKVRSCVLMLDLECHDLITEMFRHFFRTVSGVSDDHRDVALTSMETIMTLVVEESEDINPDLLSCILDVLKKENKEVLPMACQLGEKVIINCASKLKPFLLPALRASGANLDDYVKAVADVYQARDEAVEPINGDAAIANLADDGNVLINPSSENLVKVAKETLEDAHPSEEVSPYIDTVMSNGIVEKGSEDSSAANNSSKEADHVTQEAAIHDTQDETGEPIKTIPDSLHIEEPPKSKKKKSKKSKKRKGRKHNSSKSSAEPSQPIELNREAEVIDTPEKQNDTMDVDNLQSEDPAVDTTDAAINEKSSDAPISSPTASPDERIDTSPASPNGIVADETHSKKAGQEKKKEDAIKEGAKAHDVDCNKEIGSKRECDQEEKLPDSADDTGRENDKIHGSDVNPAKDSVPQEAIVGSQMADKKKSGQPKTTPGKGKRKTPAKNERKKAGALQKSTPEATKDEIVIKEESKSSSKKKRPSEEKAPKAKVYGRELVGATIKVWWPDDKKYYQGVVDSFDGAKKRHKILYCDDEIEVLNLAEEKWLLIDRSEEHAKDVESPVESADETPKVKKAKTSRDLGDKQGKTGSQDKKSGPSSSKSKAMSKSGSKKMEGGKNVSNHKEASTKKNVGKSVGKSKGSKDIKLSDYSSKSVKKSKDFDDVDDDDDDDMDTLISFKKSKQGTVKSVAKSKGKTPKSIVKSNTSTSGKAKAGTSTNNMESEDDSLEPATPSEKSKSKSHSTLKPQKSSKKRKRA